MFWHPKKNLPKLDVWKPLPTVYQSIQDEACFLIQNESGDWIKAYERYTSQARLAKILPWCGPNQ